MSLSIKEYFARAGSRYSKDDAAVIGPALHSLAEQGQMSDSTIVEVARSTNSPLHPYFEWDDQRAAHYYRIGQAQEMVREIRVRLSDGQTEPVGRTLRVVKSGDEKKPGGRVLTLDGESAIAAQRMDDAVTDLRIFREKYEPYVLMWDRFKKCLGPLSDEIEEFVSATRKGTKPEAMSETLAALIGWRDSAAEKLEIWDNFPEEFRRLLDIIADAEALARSTDKRKLRKCLRCEAEFTSLHAGNRLCEKCHNHGQTA